MAYDPGMSDPAEFIVTLAPGTSADALSATLHAQGFETTAILGALSMIVGLADPAVAAAVAIVPGVVAIEPSHAVTLSPDDPQ